ncbi:MAG: transporter, partial [Gammaproteobacteria bacterium]|nr:transporter [Gammaproteobacteria bacterium]
WNLSTGRGLAASRGPGLTLSYKLNDDWSLGLAGRYEDQEFRLDDKGVAPGGIGRDQSVPLVFNASLTPNSKLNFNVFAGVEFAGKLKIKDADDVVVEESKYDPAPIFGATAQIRF